jgi:hypothetical protein
LRGVGNAKLGIAAGAIGTIFLVALIMAALGAF